MNDLRGTYVHRGDLQRRRERVKRAVMGIACCTAALVVYENNNVDEAKAAAGAERAAAATASGEARLRPRATRSEVAIANEQLERWNRIFAFSNRYNIGAQLAGAIHDIAIDEGIEPELAFRLVRTESRFKERATSHVGAVGLTQLMPATARYFEKGITRERLYNRETNLRIGFRYLRGLIRENDGDVRLALLVYNRGPVAVNRARKAGRDPSNGYDRKVLSGYTGSGVVD
jgi:soluble lytic murein transglycosylase-like protein